MNPIDTFLSQWEATYSHKIQPLPLFTPALTQQWTPTQKRYFAQVFYHARGHFYKFLWFLGNHAQNQQEKEKVLYNLAEEFGNKTSHEEHYFRFAKALGTDVGKELIEESHYLPFLKHFNQTHLAWMDQRTWNSQLAAFSAYERLDNIDYQKLYELALSLGVSGQGLRFFIIHKQADHFDRTYEALATIWKQQPDCVIEAFEFIGSHQAQMWQNLSEAVCEFEHA